eukprot:1762021-Rhodomonas_salina.2
MVRLKLYKDTPDPEGSSADNELSLFEEEPLALPDVAELSLMLRERAPEPDAPESEALEPEALDPDEELLVSADNPRPLLLKPPGESTRPLLWYEGE